MKKALNLTAIILGITELVLGVIGLIAFIITIAKIGFLTAFIPSLIIILSQISSGATLVFVTKKEKSIFLLISAIGSLLLVILDLFVALTAGMVSCSGALFAGLASSFALLTVFQVIGYLLIAGFVALIALQVYDMIKKK